MKRREFLAAAAAPLVSGQTGAAQRPNVIFILTDDQGYGDIGAHGNPVVKTPAIDKLRSESVRLTDFHATPMCTPTRSQLMTGRDCLVNGAMNVSSGRTLLRRGFPTMANLFAAAGYRTGMFGKWHLGDTYPYRPEDRGFQEAVWFPSSHIGSTPDAWNNDYFDDTYTHNGKREKYSGYCTDVFFGEAMKWIRGANGPFFCYIPTNAPHGPLFVPDKYKEPYKDQPPNVAAFFGMIANIDENITKLDKMLEETGLRENTIVIFMTDNGATAGFNVYNAGMRGHKVTLWDGGHRVPFFMRWPGKKLAEPRDVDELITVQDVLPTLIDLCGLRKPAGTTFDGLSIAPLLNGVAKLMPDRNIVVQFGRMNVGKPEYGDATVMWKKWRLVSLVELYDISKDPGQRKDLADERPEIANRLRAHYDQWWANVQARLDTHEPVYIGNDKQNPVMLSPTEWADSFIDQGVQIRAGLPRNGVWHVQIEHDGEYEFRLRRWAIEADTAMRAPLPPHKGELGGYPAGVALPIAKAELAIAGQILRKPVGADDKECVFNIRLQEGRNTLRTAFYDANGVELCGAYYVYAERKSPVKM